MLSKFSKKTFLDRSKIFFCIIIHKKLNKSCSLEIFFLFLKKKVGSLKKLLFLFSQKDTYLAFQFLSPSVLLSCYHHLKAKNGMYFCPSIFEHFRMVWPRYLAILLCANFVSTSFWIGSKKPCFKLFRSKKTCCTLFFSCHLQVLLIFAFFKVFTLLPYCKQEVGCRDVLNSNNSQLMPLVD